MSREVSAPVQGNGKSAHTAEDENRLKGLVSEILQVALDQGATAAEVAAKDDLGLEVKAHSDELENVEFSRDRGFEITVYQGQRRGSVSTTDTRPASILESVQAALAITKHTEEDDCSGLADAERLAVDFPDLDLYHHENLSVEQAKEMASTAENAALSYDPRLYKSDGTRVSTKSCCTAYGNSHGFLQAHRTTTYSMMSDVIAKSDQGMQRAYWYTMGRRLDELDSPMEVGETAARRVIEKLDPRPIPTGDYPVVFDYTIASSLISHFISALTGRVQYLKTSYLLDSIDKKATTEAMTLKEYPFLSGAIGSRTFDTEGVATSEKCFVDQGYIRNYVLSSYSGRKLGMPTTGNASGVCNLTVETERTPVDQMLKQMDRGLVVNSLMGQGVNILTGDYSRGASGYWVQDGEYSHAVDEITVAGNLSGMFEKMIAFGDDVDNRRNIRTGSILIDQMTVAAL